MTEGSQLRHPHPGAEEGDGLIERGSQSRDRGAQGGWRGSSFLALALCALLGVVAGLAAGFSLGARNWEAGRAVLAKVVPAALLPRLFPQVAGCEIVRANTSCSSFTANETVRVYFDNFEFGKGFYGTPSFSHGSLCVAVFDTEAGRDGRNYDAILLDVPSVLEYCPTRKAPPPSEVCWDTLLAGYTIESTHNRPSFFDKGFWRSLDLVVSYEEVSDVPCGEKYLATRVGTAASPLASFTPGSELASAVISNSWYGDSGRKDYLVALEEAGLRVASYGAWHRNKPDFKESRGDKSAALRRHVFNLAFENSIDLSYVTEKVYDALAAPSIPVYLGAPDAREFVPPNSTIFVTDFASPAHLVEYLKRVASDESLYKFYHAWREPEAYAAWIARYANMHPSFAPGVAGVWDRLCDKLVRRKRLLRLKTDPTYRGST